jgi:hypothetical protein
MFIRPDLGNWQESYILTYYLNDTKLSLFADDATLLGRDYYPCFAKQKLQQRTSLL